MNAFKFCLPAIVVLAMGASALAGTRTAIVTDCCDPPVQRTYAVPQTRTVTDYQIERQTRTRQVPRTVVEQEEYTETVYEPKTVTKTRDVCRTVYDTETYEVDVCVPVTRTETVCVESVQQQTYTQPQAQSQCTDRCVSNADLAKWYAARGLGDMQAATKDNGRKEFGCIKRFLAKRAVKRLAGSLQPDPDLPSLPVGSPAEIVERLPVELPAAPPAELPVELPDPVAPGS